MPCSLYETIRSNICIQSTSKPKYPEAPLTQNSSALSLVLPAITDNVYVCLDVGVKSGLPCGDLLAQNNAAGKRNRNKVALTLNIDMRAMRVEWPTRDI